MLVWAQIPENSSLGKLLLIELEDIAQTDRIKRPESCKVYVRIIPDVRCAMAAGSAEDASDVGG